MKWIAYILEWDISQYNLAVIKKGKSSAEPSHCVLILKVGCLSGLFAAVTSTPYSILSSLLVLVGIRVLTGSGGSSGLFFNKIFPISPLAGELCFFSSFSFIKLAFPLELWQEIKCLCNARIPWISDLYQKYSISYPEIHILSHTHTHTAPVFSRIKTYIIAVSDLNPSWISKCYILLRSWNEYHSCYY